MGMDLEISPTELAELLKSGTKVRLIDVREEWEVQHVAIAGAEHIPMMQVPQHFEEFQQDPDCQIVCYCHAGMRSLTVADWMRRYAQINARSLSGGIDAWSREIDPSLPRY